MLNHNIQYLPNHLEFDFNELELVARSKHSVPTNSFSIYKIGPENYILRNQISEPEQEKMANWQFISEIDYLSFILSGSITVLI